MTSPDVLVLLALCISVCLFHWLLLCFCLCLSDVPMSLSVCLSEGQFCSNTFSDKILPEYLPNDTQVILRDIPILNTPNAKNVPRYAFEKSQYRLRRPRWSIETKSCASNSCSSPERFSTRNLPQMESTSSTTFFL